MVSAIPGIAVIIANSMLEIGFIVVKSQRRVNRMHFVGVVFATTLMATAMMIVLY